MTRLTPILRTGRKALQDLDLLKVLQSEIAHEHSSNRFQNNQSGGSLGNFLVEWDSPQSQDVVLRKTCESGEEVAVSAVLGPVTYGQESVFPREVLMKVCLKKPGLSSLLQFDCGVSYRGNDVSEFDIHNANYIPSSILVNSSLYRGPLFRYKPHNGHALCVCFYQIRYWRAEDWCFQHTERKIEHALCVYVFVKSADLVFL